MKSLHDSWQEAAKSDNCSGFISPTYAIGKYEESGKITANKIVELIETYCKAKPEKAVVIDYGCGNGRVSLPLAGMVKNVFAVDFVKEMIEQIPISESILAIKSDENTGAFDAPKLADAGFTVSVFIHNTFEDGKKIVEAIAKNIKKGGFLFLDIPIYEISKDPAGWIDVGVWTLSQLKEVAKENGLELIVSHENTGEFSYHKVGEKHGWFNILKKI